MGALLVLAADVEPWWTSNGMFEYIAERMASAVGPDVAEPIRLAALSRIGGYDITELPVEHRRAILDYLAGRFVADITENPPEPIPDSWSATVEEQKGLADRAREALLRESSG